MPRSPTTSSGPAVVELAEDWLAVKRRRASDDQLRKGNTERARRTDLARWGLLIGLVTARRDDTWPDRLDMADALESVTVADLGSAETLGRALDAARTRFAAKTVARMLTTLRGFSAWLAKSGHLPYDVAGTDDDLTVTVPRHLQPKAVGADDFVRLLAACDTPPERSRMWWPARDRAVLGALAGCGLRASEVCSARVGWIDRTTERPLLHLTGAKGDKDREVPVPARVMGAIDAYLAERAGRAGDDERFAVTPAAPLFVRTNGAALDASVLDRLVRGLAVRAGVALPTGAAAHAFRHRYGTDMALRGVPMPVMQQLLGHASADTTAVYTRATGRDLIAALDDAGML